MDEKIEIVLGPQMLHWIGRSWNGPLSSMSPLLNEIKGKTAPDKKALFDAGICDQDGNILDKLRPAISVLANPRGFTRIYFTTSPGKIFEYICYVAQDGKNASAVNEAGDLRINYPAMNDAMMYGIRQKLGSSEIRNCAFEADLTAAETVVLAAMMDLQRKAFLRAIADEKEQVLITVEIEKIAPMITQGEKDYQWLVNIFKEMLDIRGTFMPEIVPGSIDGLVSKGLVKKDGKTVSLNGPALLLSRRMLVLERYLTATSGIFTDDKKISLSGFTCLQSGINDLLIIDAYDGKAHLETVTSETLVKYLAYFLNRGPVAPSPSETYTRISIGSTLK
jgi:hypothetical protein